MSSKKLSKIGLSLLLTASFFIPAYADVFDQYNTFDGGSSSHSVYAADPAEGEANVIGHAYPGSNNENLSYNTFYGENIIENEINVRSTENIYDGNTYIGVGVYDDGVLTSNSDTFTNSILDNGDLDIVVSDIYTPTGTSNITNADVNQIATLTASSQTGSGSTLNVNTSNFTGSTTLSADTINVENSTITQQVGSSADTQTIISQNNTLIANSNTLNSKIDKLIVEAMAVRTMLVQDYYSSDSNNRSVNLSYGTASYTFVMPSFIRNTYSIVDQHINKTSTTVYGTLPRILNYKFESFESLFYAYAELFNNWYYPLRVTDPLYWRTYNLDTNEEEEVNLARVFYDISWYTAKTYESIQDFIDEFNSYKTSWFAKFDSFRTAFDTFAATNHLDLDTIKNRFSAWARWWIVFSDKLSSYRVSTTSTVNLGDYWGTTVTYEMPSTNEYEYTLNNGSIVTTTNTKYVTYYGAVSVWLNNLRRLIESFSDRVFVILSRYIRLWAILRDQFMYARVFDDPTTINLGDYWGTTVTYDLQPRLFYSYSLNNDGVIQRVSDTKYTNFFGSLYYHILSFENLLYRLALNITSNSPANSIQNSVNQLSTNLTNYTNAEQTLQNKVTSSLQSFIPDLNLLSGFVAISWVSNYLQQVYISLGTYGTVIMIGLLLGVCMQFIGYFRYKY